MEAYSLREWVHGHHSGEHGSRQAGMGGAVAESSHCGGEGGTKDLSTQRSSIQIREPFLFKQLQ